VLANLLWCLLLVVKLLLVHLVFSSQQRCEFGSALLEVCSVLFAQFGETALNNLLLNYFVGFMFPLSCQRKVLVAS
jgi:hypothetical protein